MARLGIVGAGLVLGLLACADDGLAGAIDYERCIFELELWCHNSESAGGPDPANDEQCSLPTLDEQLEAASGSMSWTHERCDDPELGSVSRVSYSNGFVGSTWFFDADGDTLARLVFTDTPAYCDGSPSVAYGARPDCSSSCVVEASHEMSGKTACP